MPQLEKQLKANQFGNRISRRTGKRSERFSEGALQTTYKIIHDDFGIGADLDKKGSINNQDEAELIPCSILKEIEKLWREATGCGWYDKLVKNRFINPHCIQGTSSNKGLDLSSFVFESPYEFPDGRLKKCGIE